MLMLVLHIAFALGLIALTLGLFLKKFCCFKAQQCESTGQGKCPGKCTSWCAMVIIVLAVLSLLCTANTGYKFWKAGAFHMEAPVATSETIQMNVK